MRPERNKVSIYIYIYIHIHPHPHLVIHISIRCSCSCSSIIYRTCGLLLFTPTCIAHTITISLHVYFSLYKILFHLTALLWESIILLLPPPPPANPTVLQFYCTCNIRPPTDPPCLCHTPYNIGDGNIV